MAIPSFYHPELSSSDSLILLAQNEASHAVKSRRLRVGDSVRVFDGQGVVASAKIVAAERREVALELIDVMQRPKPDNALVIACAVPKGDRQKIMLDMLTQLGVSGIIPLRCERSVTRFSPNMADRWRRVMIEACKQSQNPWLPSISDEIAFNELLKNAERPLIYADVTGDAAHSAFSATNDVTVLIGPEGGFSNAEINQLKRRSAQALSLGGHILRTEAATVVAAAQFNANLRLR